MTTFYYLKVDDKQNAELISKEEFESASVNVTEHMQKTIEILDMLIHETCNIYTDQQKEEMNTAQQYLIHCFGRQDIRHQENTEEE